MEQEIEETQELLEKAARLTGTTALKKTWALGLTVPILYNGVVYRVEKSGIARKKNKRGYWIVEKKLRFDTKNNMLKPISLTDAKITNNSRAKRVGEK